MASLSLPKLFGVTKNRTRDRSRTQARLHLEWLEPRMALATLHVGSDPGEFPTIQAAVLAAQRGDTIKVDPGTYQEQVTINNVGHNRDNIKLVGAKHGAIIQAPPVMVDDKAIVEVDGSRNVTIERFTIQGPGGAACDSLRFGVLVNGNGSATITGNHITEIRDNPLGGCQNGIGILVGHQLAGQTARATISKNIIDDYQKGGIVVDNTGSSAEITKNAIVGVGPTELIAQSGIQISRGAAARVMQNVVFNNEYTLPTATSAGILLFDALVVAITHNGVFANDIGIHVFDTAGAVISGNVISNNALNGIALEAKSGASVTQNTTNNNGSDNDEDAGIGLYGSTNNTISRNTSRRNKGDGIFADAGSTGNTFEHNDLRSNTNFDAEDRSIGTGTAGTANTWKKNKGQTSSPPGLVS